MKNFLFSSIALIAFVGCSDVSSSPNIPSGTFVRLMESEFSIAEDTVVVTPQQDGLVQVHHNTAYNRIGEGPIDKKIKNSTFIARYEPEGKECINPKTGDRYSFPQDGKSLIYNGAIYTAVP